MKLFSQLLIVAGLICLSVFGYQYAQHEQKQAASLAEAQERIGHNHLEKGQKTDVSEHNPDDFTAEDGEAFATLEIPKLDKTLPVVEGTDADALSQGVGHMDNTVLPGQDEQIVLSGHRDTVFRDFDKIEVGDQYKVETPYGTYTYEIRETEIVPEDDTSVVGEMGEEALVVTTCYPFDYVGYAPKRYVTYAYPVDVEHSR